MYALRASSVKCTIHSSRSTLRNKPWAATPSTGMFTKSEALIAQHTLRNRSWATTPSTGIFTKSKAVSFGDPTKLRRLRYAKKIVKRKRLQSAETKKLFQFPKTMPNVPKIPAAGPQIMPKPLKSVPAAPKKPSTSSSSGSGSSRKASGGKTSYDRMREWLKQNGPILILNFGSMCTLFGFTRQDVLELRALSMTGSLSSVGYFALSGTRPIPYLAMGWSALFAATNAFNIYRILDERSHRVVFSDEEEDIFVEHFMPHGLTPKQFKKMFVKSKRVKLPKGEILTKEGNAITSVYLVISGKTRASTLGRHLSAVSSRPGNSVALKGGDAGAWVGEIAFLEAFWQREHSKISKQKQLPEPSTVASTDSSAVAVILAEKVTKNKTEQEEKPKVIEEIEETETTVGRAIHTVVAAEDCVLLEWTHKDLEALMKTSNDMRGAMTRSMTAAIVGKIVNFTVSKSTPTAKATWSTWLEDWKQSGGAHVTITRKDRERIIRDQIASN